MFTYLFIPSLSAQGWDPLGNNVIYYNGSVRSKGFNLSDNYDNVLTSTDEVRYHHLIGTYRGFDKNAIFIAGFHNKSATTYATQKVYIGDPISQLTVFDLMSGRVGIGTATPTQLLDVRGTIRANEIIVNTAGADFVFADDYRLRPLQEVEQFITENKHLPDIASADSMAENGVGVSELQTKLLQKVEELTLYVIEQGKQNESLKKQVDAQQREIEILKQITN